MTSDLIGRTDVLIVGGGVIGLSIARELRRRDARAGITVIDRGKVGQEASWAAGGMLAPNLECSRHDDFYRLCARSGEMYPKFADELLSETGIDIELERSGTLYLAFSAGDEAALRQKFVDQSAAGSPVARLRPKELSVLEPNLTRSAAGALLYPNDWQVEPRKLIAALAEFCGRNRVRVIEDTVVESLLERRGEISGVRAGGAEISAGQVVLAGGAWTSQIELTSGRLPFTVKPVRGQMLCYQTDGRRLRRVVHTRRGYLVPRVDGRILAGATCEDAGFEKELTSSAAAGLAEMAAEIMPELADMPPADHWCGFRPFAEPDGLPVIGPIPGHENVFAATGHYRNGILLAPVTAAITAGAILTGEASEFITLYRPRRRQGSAGVAV